MNSDAVTDRDRIVFELRQVSFKTILANISLSVYTGSQTAVIGATGAGKSTVLRLLNRSIDPTAGKIYLRGQDMQKMPVPALRRQVMLLPQEISLLGMTVAEAIGYPLKLQGFTIAQIQTRLQEWTERLQIDRKLMQRSEIQLSLGQRQWVAIARALIAEPDVLLLDEPTSALDRSRAHLLLETLQELSQSPKCTTVIMVNHQLDLVASWCDRVIQIHKGQIATCQPAQSVNWSDLSATFESALVNSDGDDWDS